MGNEWAYATLLDQYGFGLQARGDLSVPGLIYILVYRYIFLIRILSNFHPTRIPKLPKFVEALNQIWAL